MNSIVFFFASRISRLERGAVGGGRVGVVNIKTRALNPGAVVQQEPDPIRSPGVTAVVEHGEGGHFAAGEGEPQAGLEVGALHGTSKDFFLFSLFFLRTQSMGPILA